MRLLLAARAYAAEIEALEEGEIDEEELVAKAAMGLEGKDGMSDVQRRYAGKIAETLQEKAAAIAARQRSGSEAFVGGQFLYERGRYDEAVVAFEAALKESGEATQLGGDIALWLALAYDASGKREACLALYKRLEDTHSSRGIRKQASELRYILEAPQLEIRPEERITIPVPDAATQYKCVELVTLPRACADACSAQGQVGSRAAAAAQGAVVVGGRVAGQLQAQRGAAQPLRAGRHQRAVLLPGHLLGNACSPLTH